jgi:2-polyprenyl-3-methyl-5-hydroxy-6-metoxy-1,4-benzoquinol methylase
MTCFLCGRPGVTIYRDMQDCSCRVPGIWKMLRCSPCEHWWLEPFPSREEASQFYAATYYTHRRPQESGGLQSLRERLRLAVLASVPGYEELGRGNRLRRAGKLLSLLPGIRSMAECGLMLLSHRQKGSLLDVGCGSGRFLDVMHRAGWSVTGVDPDAGAIAAAETRSGLRTVHGELENADLPTGCYDAVTLSHVIEHSLDPAQLLKECRKRLREGGVLVLSTPNPSSWGHAIFRGDWNTLDVPRHLNLFSPAPIARMLEAAGFRNVSVRTVAKSALPIWTSSVRRLSFAGTAKSLVPLAVLSGIAFQCAELACLPFWNQIGEEIFAIGVNPGGST